MHIYHENGKEYPSVTTIIHSILLYPEPLLKWSNSLGFNKKTYSKVMMETSAFGTCIHDALYHYIKGDEGMSVFAPLMFIDRANMTLAKTIPFLKSVGITPGSEIFAEETIISEKLGYAGTLDLVSYYESVKTLIDYKTSKKARESMYIQLAAYDKLLQVEKGITVDQAMILTVGEKKVTPYKLTREELDSYYDVFEHMHAIFNSLNMLDRLKEDEKC